MENHTEVENRPLPFPTPGVNASKSKGFAMYEQGLVTILK